MRSPWTNIEIKVLKALYPDNNAAYIGNVLHRSARSIYGRAKILRIGKSDEFKKSVLSGRITKLMIKGTEYRFEKGHEPFNKGLPISEFMSAETQSKFLQNTYRKGHVPHNTKQDKEISIRSDKKGNIYKWIRISLGIWEALHVHNWQKVNGDIPDGFIVVFKSTDRMNCDVGNLELITREENMVRNSIHRYPEELQLTMKALKKLKHQLNDKN